jgi:hypothetical protein
MNNRFDQTVISMKASHGAKSNVLFEVSGQ